MTGKKPPKTPEQKIAEIQKKLDATVAKQNQLKAQISMERQKQSKKERALDTRRCVIAGRYALKHIESNPHSEIAVKFKALLDEYVTRDADRVLFDFLDNNPTNEN